MSDGIAYSDIIILALIAGFILLRLRSILGSKTDDDAGGYLNRVLPVSLKPREPIIQLDEKSLRSKTQENADSYIEGLEAGPVADSLRAIKAKDAQFNAAQFLQGAKMAFEMVFDAFAKGDKKTLSLLMSDAIFQHFAKEIDARAALAQKTENTLVSVKADAITDAALNGSVARLGVHFASEQVIVTRDSGGTIVEGNPSDLHHVEDHWLFERDVTSKNPNWKIIET